MNIVYGLWNYVPSRVVMTEFVAVCLAQWISPVLVAYMGYTPYVTVPLVHSTSYLLVYPCRTLTTHVSRYVMDRYMGMTWIEMQPMKPSRLTIRQPHTP